ncbi:MAG: hypothetical protein IJB95_00770, partial [Clostridia bacterium]|nr:hypothetical protein [Clostridia bacterium]
VELKIASVPQSITQDYAKVEQLQSQLKVLEKKHNGNNQRKKLFTISFAVALLLAVVLACVKQYVPAGIVGAVAIACGACLCKQRQTGRCTNGRDWSKYPTNCCQVP